MALNFSLDSLMEQSLLSDDPWWRYILDGAGWTVGLAVSAFLLALVLGIIVGTLRTSPIKIVRGACEAWIELFRNIPLIGPDFHLVFRRSGNYSLVQRLDD